MKKTKEIRSLWYRERVKYIQTKREREGMWKGGRQRAIKMKKRESEGGIVWKMRNQK